MQSLFGLLYILLSFTICKTKEICIQNYKETYLSCRNLPTLHYHGAVTVYNSDLRGYVNDDDTDILLRVHDVKITLDLNLNAFNNKSITIINYNPNDNYFNVTGISNINMTFIVYRVKFNGTFNDSQSHLSLDFRYKCELDSTEIFLKSYSMIYTKIPFTKIYADDFIYKYNEGNITLNDDFIDVNNQTVEFPNKNIKITIESNNFKLISNITKKSFISSICFSNCRLLNILGDDNLNLLPLTFINSSKIRTNMTHISNSFFEFYENTNCTLEPGKNIAIDSQFNLPQNTNLFINSQNIDNLTRISFEINSLLVKNKSNLVILSSWIDLTINSLTLNSDYIPITPCVGSGGASSTIINNVIYDSNDMLPFNSLEVQLDISGYHTDKTLDILFSKDWDMITFKSFTEKVPALNPIPNIKFNSNVYGFGGYWNIFNARSEITDDYIIKTNISSFTTIPFLIDYYANTSLPELIEPAQKMINLTFKGYDYLDVDLTGIKTKNAIITFSSEAKINSIQMNNYSENQNVNQLIFSRCLLGNGKFQFNAKLINFTDTVTVNYKIKPEIIFDPNIQIDCQSNKFVSLYNFTEGLFPLTHIHMGNSSSTIKSSSIVFKNGMTIPITKIPKIIIYLNLTTTLIDHFSTNIEVWANKINDITYSFEGLNNTKNISVYINFDESYQKYNISNFGIDFGNFKETNTISLFKFPKMNYFTFKGVIDEIESKYIENSYFCACKGSSCDLCGPNVTTVSYEELDSKIKNYDETQQVYIYVAGTDDTNIPVLSFDSIVNKDANIVGIGQNPKIKIDCTKRLDDLSTFIKFSNISIVHSAGEILAVSNLEINKNCKLDASFNEVSFIVDIFKCNLNHLTFKSLFCNRLLKIRKKVSNFNSHIKVSFGKGATFVFTFPNLVTFRGSCLIFDSLEFNLENSIPICDVVDDDINIIGENGNVENLYKEFQLKINNAKSIKFSGTWEKLNYTKYFVVENRKDSLNVFFDLESIPIMLTAFNNTLVCLLRKNLNILGSFNCRSMRHLNISTPLTDDTHLYVNCWYFEGKSAGKIYYNCTNIHTVIKQIKLIGRDKKIPYFVQNIGFDGHNTLKVLERTYIYTNYTNNSPFSDGFIDYQPYVKIHCYPDDQRLYDLFGTNITIAEFNPLDKYEYVSYPYYDINLKTIFNNNNINVARENGSMIVIFKDIIPFKNGIKLNFGECEKYCASLEEITEADFENFYRFVPRHNSNVSIELTKSMTGLGYFDLDRDDIIIPKLTIYSHGLKTDDVVNIKFGHSVKEIEVISAKLTFIESNFSIQKVTLKLSSVLLGSINYDNIASLCVYYPWGFPLVDEYKNDMEIIVDNKDESDTIINFTSYGFDIIFDYYNTEVYNVSVLKIPKLILTLHKSTPMINAVDELTEIQYFKLLQFINVKQINLGTGWHRVKFTSKVKISDVTNLHIHVKSTYFDSWDIMNHYPIRFHKSLKNYRFNYETINNSNISLYNNYGQLIFFWTIYLEGISSFAGSYYSVPININSVIVKNGISTIDNSNIKIIEIQPGSTLNSKFDLTTNLTQLNLHWDLDQPPIFNSLIFQDYRNVQLNIIYDGSSIRKRKLLFDEFLKNGTLIISNVDANIIKNVHFISENITEFNDGDDLALECRLVNNEIYMFTTRQLYNESEVFETDSPSQSPSQSLYPSPTPSESIYPSSTPCQSEYITSDPIDIISSIPIVDVTTTEKPIIPPTVSKYESKNDTIILEQNGYRDGDDFIPVDKNDNKISLISSNQQKILLKAGSNNDNNQENSLFISPGNPETVISISSPNDGKVEYTTEKYGVHANSNNPTINLPQSKVPLSLYNNEDSKIELINENDEYSDTISLEKLTIDKGTLTINLQNSVSSVEFEEVETFENGKVEAFNDGTQVETKIGLLKLNPNSLISFSNINFNKSIKAYSNTKIEVETKAKFNDQTSIELMESSFIEFKQSIIEGICKEIKIVDSNSRNFAKIFEGEKTAKLICGVKFDCHSWIEKYHPNEVYKYSKCDKYEDEMCLFASNKDGNSEKDSGNDNKKPLSGGIIAAIVIVIVVVIAAVIVGIIIWKKKSRKVESDVENNENNQNENEIDL